MTIRVNEQIHGCYRAQADKLRDRLRGADGTFVAECERVIFVQNDA
jgi:hypothetical protein